MASRRAAESMIAEGRVRVNGVVVTEMGSQADPVVDKIMVDGKAINVPLQDQAGEEFTYIAMNKPPGVVTTAKDTHGRVTVLDLLKSQTTQPTREASTTVGQGADRGAQREIPRVFPVGRLDADTTGLILLTNDGDLTYRLTHPRFGVEKEYHALVRGNPSAEALQQLRTGVMIEGEKTARARVTEVTKHENSTLLRITIHEGRKRQVRLMCAAVGHHIIELKRVRFGPIALGELKPGAWRQLATHEIHALRKEVNLMR